MVRLGVLGAGSHSRIHHGPSLQRCQQERPEAVILAAVCDLDEGRARSYAQEFGFSQVYTDLDLMVQRERLDGIVAITPLSLTAELAARVARLGVPLVVEKPPGATPAQARALHDALRDSGTPHMISFNRRFNPAVVRARAWLQDRPRPHLLISRMLRLRRREDRFVAGTGIHAVDTVVAFMGRPTRVHSCRQEVGPLATPMVDARVEFATGGAAVFCFAPAAGHVEETLELVGDEYDIQVDVAGCALRIRHRGECVHEWRTPAGTPEWELAGALGETRAFIRCVETGRGWWPEMDEGLWSSLAAEAIEVGGETALEEA